MPNTSGCSMYTITCLFFAPTPHTAMHPAHITLWAAKGSCIWPLYLLLHQRFLIQNMGNSTHTVNDSKKVFSKCHYTTRKHLGTTFSLSISRLAHVRVARLQSLKQPNSDCKHCCRNMESSLEPVWDMGRRGRSICPYRCCCCSPRCSSQSPHQLLQPRVLCVQQSPSL